MPAIYRAPMRARDRDLPPGVGAEHGVERDIVGIGDALPEPARTLEEAVSASIEVHGDKAGRMLRHFADLPDGAFVWTRVGDDCYRLGQLAGPWRYDDSPAARQAGIHHVRPASWLDRSFGEDDVPAAVAATFARGGRNFQRIRDERAERETVELWERSREAA